MMENERVLDTLEMTPDTRASFREWERASAALKAVRDLLDVFPRRKCVKEAVDLAETWCATARQAFREALDEQTRSAPRVNLTLVDKKYATPSHARGERHEKKGSIEKPDPRGHPGRARGD